MKVESFLTQWELYCRVNANNTAIQNQYQKTMLFLTYIKGDLVRTWVLAASCWLGQEVALYHVDQYDPYLWTSIEGAFRRHADTLGTSAKQTTTGDMKEGKIDARNLTCWLHIVLLWLSHLFFLIVKYNSYKSENWYVGRSYQGIGAD
jgi:hypothetical protein